jgi:regulator of sigma E protease
LERQIGPADGTPNSAQNASGAPEGKNRASTGDIITVLVVAAALAAVGRYLDVLSFLKVLLGLSFVIFIHEFGHFAVAKLCDVHVTHFSIGFGPVIPGCWFKWGETTYQICLLPLGGYVQMVGQVDGDESSDGSESDPRSYRNKSVGARMAIISAGVIMNAIFALLCFIVIYRGPGRERLAAVISATDGGGPAFAAGLRSTMEIRQIGDETNPSFDALKVHVMNSSTGEKIRIVAQLPDDSKPLDIAIEARKSRDDPNPMIGVVPSWTTKLMSQKEVGPTLKSPVEHLSPATNAKPPFQFGDLVVGATDPKNPATITPLAEDPFKKNQKDYFDLVRRMQLLAGKDIVLRVKRGEENVDITVPPAYRTSIGVSMEMGNIVAVRKNSPADLAKIQLPESGKKFVKGDLIEKVEVSDAKGQRKVFEKETLDPERLPLQLRDWAQELVDANKIEPAPKVTLYLRRHRQEAGPENEPVIVHLEWDNAWANDRAIPLSLASPLAIPELGLAYKIRTTVANVVDPASPLKTGDVIKNIRVTYQDIDGKEKQTNWQVDKELGSEEWAHTGFVQLQSTQKLDKIEFKIERDKKIEEISIVPAFDATWPLTPRGLLLLPDTRRQKADTTLEAINLGVQDTHKSMLNVLNGIRQMIVGRIAWKKHLGGPISIARIAYGVAGQDFWEFVFFLGMISINLAVINFLPIPILDGGHMVFLIYEKLRGKPASEGVRTAATYLGLAFIACLILLVSWLDIGRLLT